MTGPESADSRQHGIIRLTSPTQFPATLRQLRHQAGLTQGELARRSGLSKTTIDYLLAGKFGPTLDTLTKLANALNHRVALIDQELQADYLHGVSDTLTLIRNELDRQAADDTNPTRQLLNRLAGALGLDETGPSGRLSASVSDQNRSGVAESTPDTQNGPEAESEWICFPCGYHNTGGICTHCGWIRAAERAREDA